MFYELVYGVLPFTGETMAALMFRIAREHHCDTVAIRTDLIKNIPALRRILVKILAKDPENRYQTGSDFRLTYVAV